MIKHIKLEKFKNISIFETDLDEINVLVGSNNSGKSSVLHGIHFSILAEAARRQSGNRTISQQELLYLPTSDFSLLRKNSPYTNYSGATSSLTLVSDICSDGENEDSFSITIYKGRNFGNVGVTCKPNNPFRQLVTSYSDLYSIYVPGLSGIPLTERLYTKAVIKSATANGDANLYLRNVLYYIKTANNLDSLNELIQQVFPNIRILMPYDPDNDPYIKVHVWQNGNGLPLELSGTGFLQIVQIMAYTLCFQPKLLLLDEPDEHLHPDNQRLLVEALKLLVKSKSIQVILCTHSRHILAALDSEAKFIWMKDGSIKESNSSSDMYNILLDIGALDTYDKILEGIYTCVFITEDEKTKYLKRLLEYNGFNMSKTLVLPYKSCSNIETAIQLADFIHRRSPECMVVIHRDRDFMTDAEVDIVKEKIDDRKTTSFITDGSDIESYFVNPAHLAHIMGQDIEDISTWLNELAQEHHVEIQSKFQNKRSDIQYSSLYRKNRDECPHFLDLFGKDIPTRSENRMGKLMLRIVRGESQLKFHRQYNIIQNSPYMRIERLQEILNSL